jgi:metal-responsive CopG/Arc/MetJ family transcriptional regulator
MIHTDVRNKTMRQKAKKERVTLSLNSDILAAVDELVKQSHLSRSGVVESVLEDWYEQERRDQLSREAAEYYRSLSARERREEAAIAKYATKAARKVWAEGE